MRLNNALLLLVRATHSIYYFVHLSLWRQLSSRIQLFLQLQETTAQLFFLFNIKLDLIFPKKKESHCKFKETNALEDYIEFKKLGALCTRLSRSCYKFYLEHIEGSLQNSEYRQPWRCPTNLVFDQPTCMIKYSIFTHILNQSPRRLIKPLGLFRRIPKNSWVRIQSNTLTKRWLYLISLIAVKSCLHNCCI